MTSQALKLTGGHMHSVSDEEIWMPLAKPLYKDKYIVSSRGRVARLLKPNENHSSGYHGVHVSHQGLDKYYTIHRAVAEAFLTKPSESHVVNHKDGDKLNNHLSNLEWCTLSENTRHSFKLGLQVSLKGLAHGMTKLTEKQVLEIRDSKGSCVKVGEKYGVSPMLISKIRNRKLWKHL